MSPANRLVKALEDVLPAIGIDAEIWSEPVRGTTLSRVLVLAKKFDRLDHSERQNLVWQVATEILEAHELRRISMILTLSPRELGIPQRKKRRR